MRYSRLPRNCAIVHPGGNEALRRTVYRKAATERLDAFVGPKDRAVPWKDVHYTA